MSNAPLLPLNNSRPNHNAVAEAPITLRECRQEIVQLKSAAKCTYCAAKVLNFLCLPLSMPCCALLWCLKIGAKQQPSRYTDNQDGRDYCLETSCKSPCWHPVTQFPDRQLPETTCDLLIKETIDPCGCLCCSPCSDQVMTRDFLPKEKSERLRYLENVEIVLRAAPPPPQHMGVPQAVAPLNLSPENIRASMLINAFYDASNQRPSVLQGPLALILEDAGPIPALQKRQVTFHPTPPSSPPSSSALNRQRGPARFWS